MKGPSFVQPTALGRTRKPRPSRG